MHSVYEWFGGLFGFEVCRSVKFMFWLMSGISLFIIVGIIVRTAEWIGKIRGRQERRGRQLLTIMTLLVLVASGCSRKTFIGGHLTDKQKIYLLEARCENLEKNVAAYQHSFGEAERLLTHLNTMRNIEDGTMWMMRNDVDSIRRELDGIHMVLQCSIMNGVYGDVRLDSLIDALRNNPWLNMKIEQFHPLPGNLQLDTTLGGWRQLIEAANSNFTVDPGYDLGTVPFYTDSVSTQVYRKGAWIKMQGSTKTTLKKLSAKKKKGRTITWESVQPANIQGGGWHKVDAVTLPAGHAKRSYSGSGKKKKAITWESVMGSDWKKTKLDTLKKH